MIHGANIVARLDPTAFEEKLREGARAAVAAARHLQTSGHKLSELRLQQIVRTHHVPG
jgi:hypothetical protein